MRVRTIQSYFAPSIGNSNSEGPSLFSSATTASAATTTVNAANNSGQSVTVTAKAASSSTDRASSKTNSNANTQTIATLQSTIQDLKKQLEVSKNGREQLENKVRSFVHSIIAHSVFIIFYSASKDRIRSEELSRHSKNC